ncbi:MAG: MlaA family lipoprotein [Opitutaceae bacterium]
MKPLFSKRSFYGLAAALICFSCSPLAAQDDADLYGDDLAMTNVQDPLESVNRFTFGVNDFLMLNVIEPVSKAYTWITPDPVEEGAKNAFRNVRYPIRFVSNVLQGRFDGAWVETGRFAINSTLGVAGVFTPADNMEGFEPIPSEDIGQVLGAWGVSEGPYVVLPLLGPSNLRDALGLFGDAAAHPLRSPFDLTDNWSWEWGTALSVSEIVVSSPTLIQRYEQLKGGSIDPYSSMKNGYTQLRKAAIAE